MKKIAVMLMTTLTLAGCVGSGGSGGSGSLPPPSTQAQAKLRQEAEISTRTIVEGAVVGAALGGLGMAIADLAGARVDTTDYLIAAGAGAAIGGLAGSYVAQKQKEYASAEDQLDSVIADAKVKNQQARDLVGTMQTVLDEHKRELARLRKGVRSGTATQAQLDAALASVRTDRQVMQQAVDGTKKNRDILSEARNSFSQKAASAQERSQVRALDGEIAQLSGRIDAMSEIVGDLSQPL
ncbi:hypothetical protein KXR53_23595 [Inquilinus limosus]|uniref:hypothetical protein n=1 Tax=Inquilinus limosus TaxID=171674 RepID=UPI003F15DA89